MLHSDTKFRSLKEEYIPFPRMDMLSRAASCKLSHTRVVRRRVFEGLGGGWRKKDRKTKCGCGSVDRRRIDFLPSGYASTPLVFFSSLLAPLKKKNPRQKTISRAVLRHRDRPLRSFHSRMPARNVHGTWTRSYHLSKQTSNT